jgi:hypothetical protein
MKVLPTHHYSLTIVYNSVYRLDLKSFEWTTVTPLPNSLPPPTKRCGHSAALWRNHIIIIYGGETDARAYPNDIYAFNTRSHTWTQFQPRGPSPEARSRAAVVLVDDLLYICGGTNENGKVLDDLVVLDLDKMAWRRGERFECRYDHTVFHYDEKIFIYGGLTEHMNRSQDLLSLHLPTLTRTLTRIAGPATPSANIEGHFFYPVTSSPSPVLLDFMMPVNRSSSSSRRKTDATVSALDLQRMHWVVLESSPVIREPGFVWENLVRGDDGRGKAYFIGYPGGFANDVFSHVLEVDLSNFGVVVGESSRDTAFPTTEEGLGGIARDLSTLLEEQETCDFTIITDYDPDDDAVSSTSTSTPQMSNSQITDLPDEPAEHPSIRCHTLILLARWPHFKRIMSAQMSEFHNRQLVLPEPYTVVKALVTFFYSDRLPFETVPVLARLLVLSNLYNVSRLRTLCLGRLLRDLSVEYATIVWAAAREADERGLERRAGKVCFENWGEVVRTRGFRDMKREDVLELCGLVGRGARVVDPSATSEVGSESEIEEDGEEDEGDAEGDEEGTGDEEMEF